MDIKVGYFISFFTCLKNLATEKATYIINDYIFEGAYVTLYLHFNPMEMRDPQKSPFTLWWFLGITPNLLM